MTTDQIQQVTAAVVGMIVFLVLLPVGCFALYRLIKYFALSVRAAVPEAAANIPALFAASGVLLRSERLSAQALGYRHTGLKSAVWLAGVVLLAWVLVRVSGLFG